MHCTPLIRVASATATIWYVPGDFSTIQEAVNAADSNDTILVGEGTYHEHISIFKSNLTIMGEDPLNTIIDGDQTSSVIYLGARGVTISGFRIQNAFFGINMVQANNCTIKDNAITNMTEEGMPFLESAGMRMMESSNNIVLNNTITYNDGYGIQNWLNSNANTFENNTVVDNKYGISIDNSMHTTLKNNNLANNTYNFGVNGGYTHNFIHSVDMTNIVEGKPIVYLTNQENSVIDPTVYPTIGYLAAVNSHNITIRNLSMSNNLQGILIVNTTDSSLRNLDLSDNYYGIELLSSSLNNIECNEIESDQVNQEVALHIQKAEFNTILNNRIIGNHKGIHLIDHSNNNTITENTLANNTCATFIEVYSTGNTFYHNNFINNTEQVRIINTDLFLSNNTWDMGYPSGGNYWSDYTDEDGNGDGIGDTPYIIDDLNKDNYPLMEPIVEEVTNIAITNVTANPKETYVGKTVNISVAIANQGTSPQTFSVTAYFDNNPIGTQTITDLAPSTETTVIFNWNTSMVAPQNYTVKAYATQVIGETNLDDNTFTDGIVRIKILGDVNGDDVVDVFDLSIVGLAYGSVEGEPGYSPQADITEDGLVDIRDLVIVAHNYGESV